MDCCTCGRVGRWMDGWMDRCNWVDRYVGGSVDG